MGITSAVELAKIGHAAMMQAYGRTHNTPTYADWSILSDKVREEWITTAAAIRDAVVGIPLGDGPATTVEHAMTAMQVAEIHEFITQLKPLLDRIPTSMMGMAFPGLSRKG